MSNDNTITSDGQGVLVGVQPAQPQNTQQWVATARPDQVVSQPIAVVDQPLQQPNSRFTQEDIERARQQEKDKLYPRIEEMSKQLKQLQAEREAEAGRAPAAGRRSRSGSSGQGRVRDGSPHPLRTEGGCVPIADR